MKRKEYSSLGLVAAILVPESVEEFELNAAGPGATTPKLGSCLEEANANIVYRGALAEFRSKMLEAVELTTSIVREKAPTGTKRKQTVIVKGGNGAPDTQTEQEVDVMKFKLSEAKYFGAVLAQLDVEEDYFQPLADVVISGVGTLEGEGDKKVFTLSAEGKEKLNNLATTYDIESTEELQKLGTVIGVGIVFDASAVEREAPVPKKTGASFLAAADALIAKQQAEATAAKLAKLLGVEVKPDRDSLGKAIQLWDHKNRAEEKKRLAEKVAALEV